MSYVLPTHQPQTGAIAPSTWGVQLNSNFTALNTGFRVELFPYSSGEVPLSGLAGAPYSVVQSSTGGTIKPQYPVLTFDASTDQGRMWNRSSNRLMGGTFAVNGAFYMASATSGNVILAAQIAAVSSGDGTVTAKAFAASNSQSVAVPASAETEQSFTLTLTNNDSIVALDRFTLVFLRDADNANDNAEGNMLLTRLDLFYSLV